MPHSALLTWYGRIEVRPSFKPNFTNCDDLDLNLNIQTSRLHEEPPQRVQLTPSLRSGPFLCAGGSSKIELVLDPDDRFYCSRSSR